MFHSIGLLTTLLLSVCYQSAVAQNPTSSGSSTPTSGSSITALAADLSTSCQSAAGSLITGDLGSCANIIGLASVIGSNGSIIPPLTNWITTICAADPCSNNTLSSAQQSVTSACGADAQKGSAIAVGLTSIITNYASVRNMLCSQYVSNSTFCVPSIFQNIQAATGQNISLLAITSMLSSGFSGSAFSKVSPGAYCNDCGHAIVTFSAPIVAAASASMTASMSTGNSTMSMPNNTSSDSTVGICGASFNDGKVPSSVKVAAKGSSAAANAQNSAGARASISFSNAALVTLSLSLLYLVC